MKYLIMLSLLVGCTAHADYIEGAQSAPKCFQAFNGTSIMKLEYEYKLGYSTRIKVGMNATATRQYLSKKFLNAHANEFEEIDCEAFTWELK